MPKHSSRETLERRAQKLGLPTENTVIIELTEVEAFMLKMAVDVFALTGNFLPMATDVQRIRWRRVATKVRSAADGFKKA